MLIPKIYNGICTILLKQSSVKKMFLKVPQNLQENTFAKVILVKFQARDLYLYKIQTPVQMFSRNFTRFCITYDYHVLCKICALKNFAIFTAKFILPAASSITENKPCLEGCKFIDVLQDWLQKNTCARISFLINFIKKETLAQVFSWEFCEISKSTFYTKQLRTTAFLSLSTEIHFSIDLALMSSHLTYWCW